MNWTHYQLKSRMNRTAFLKILTFFVYLAAQVLLFNKVVLFDYAFCFIYLGFLLTFPFELPIIPAMLIGFATGLSVENPCDTFISTFPDRWRLAIPMVGI